MKTETLKERLPIDFTGIVITCFPDSKETKHFFLFQNGRVELGLWYGDTVIPPTVEDWINENNFAGLKVYTDDYHFISKRDYEMLTSVDGGQLTQEMNCVEVKY